MYFDKQLRHNIYTGDDIEKLEKLSFSFLIQESLIHQIYIKWCIMH